MPDSLREGRAALAPCHELRVPAGLLPAALSRTGGCLQLAPRLTVTARLDGWARPCAVRVQAIALAVAAGDDVIVTAPDAAACLGVTEVADAARGILMIRLAPGPGGQGGGTR